MPACVTLASVAASVHSLPQCIQQPITSSTLINSHVNPHPGRPSAHRQPAQEGCRRGRGMGAGCRPNKNTIQFEPAIVSGRDLDPSAPRLFPFSSLRRVSHIQCATSSSLQLPSCSLLRRRSVGWRLIGRDSDIHGIWEA